MTPACFKSSFKEELFSLFFTESEKQGQGLDEIYLFPSSPGADVIYCLQWNNYKGIYLLVIFMKIFIFKPKWDVMFQCTFLSF